jgi:hypothetical protein
VCVCVFLREREIVCVCGGSEGGDCGEGAPRAMMSVQIKMKSLPLRKFWSCSSLAFGGRLPSAMHHLVSHMNALGFVFEKN